MEAGVGLVEISYFESAGSSLRRESFWYSIEVDCSSLNENDGRRSASGTHLLDEWARAPTYNSLSHAILNLTYRSGQEWSEDIRSRGMPRNEARFFPILPTKNSEESFIPASRFFPSFLSRSPAIRKSSEEK